MKINISERGPKVPEINDIDSNPTHYATIYMKHSLNIDRWVAELWSYLPIVAW